MIINSLEIEGYRNYKSEYFNLSPEVNILYGNNAQGKTNALESVFMCATGKSHQGAKDKEIIGFNYEEAHIKILFEKKNIPHRIDVHLKKSGRKGIAIDCMPIKKASELYGFFHVIFFGPNDLSIVKNAPVERRRFIDQELCQLDKIYTEALTEYNKVIENKNKLLKLLESKPSYINMLPEWNSKLAYYAKMVIDKRSTFIDELRPIVKDIHSSLSSGSEDIDIIYQPNVLSAEIEDILLSEVSHEKAAKMSLIGPHRDDLIITINGVDVRTYGSQGQQRTAALSLKLSEIELVKNKTGDTPVLLLDDVLSELDESRQDALLSRIKDIQTILTCTGIDDVIKKNFGQGKTFFIEEGRVRETI